MSRPGFENIDLWLFEYTEGNLSPEQIEQLRLFVLIHPELEIELDAWEGSKVTPSALNYPRTEQLLRKPSYTGLPLSVGLTALAILLLFLLPVDLTSTADAVLITSTDSAINDQVNKRIHDLESELLELKNINQELQLKLDQLASPSSNFVTTLKPNSIESGMNESSLSSIEADRNVHINSDFTNSSLLDMTSNGSVNDDNAVNRASLLQDNGTDQIDHLATVEPETIESTYNSNLSKKSSAEEASSSKSSGYKRTFSSKVKSFGRTLQRMMDNPIALKNSRDPQFGIPDMTAQDINFSAAGTLMAPRVETMSRAQFLGSEQELFTNKINVDGYSYAMRGGIAVQMYHSTFHNGGIQHGRMAITYAPKLSVNKYLSIEPSVRFKMGAKVLDYDRVSSLDQVELQSGSSIPFYQDGQQPIGKQLWYKDLGAGLMVNTKWFFAGVNVDNVLRHKDNIYSNNWAEQQRSAINFTASFGTDWENAKENMRLSPYLVFNSSEGIDKLYIGANYQWEWFTLGAGVSSYTEPMASIGMKFKHFSLNYTADYSKSQTLNNYLLSHQVSLRITGKTSRFGKRLTNL